MWCYVGLCNDSLGDSSAVTQKEEAYMKRETGQNTLQDDCRHRHHSQGNNLNEEGKAADGQACIGEEEKYAMQISSNSLLGQCRPDYLKGPLVDQGGCNKENHYPTDLSGMNEGQNQKGGGLSNTPGPLTTAEGCHKEEPRPATQTLKENPEKFSKVYSRQKNSSQFRARTPHIEAQYPPLPHCSPTSADQNDIQLKAQNQTFANSGGRLKSIIQCSDEMMLEAQHLWNLGKDLDMEIDLDTLNFLHSYASMECRDREEVKELGNRISPQ